MKIVKLRDFVEDKLDRVLDIKQIKDEFRTKTNAEKKVVEIIEHMEKI